MTNTPQPTEEKKELPKIDVNGDILTITITAADLQWLAEQKPDSSYKVLDPIMFLNHFAANLEEYQTRNGVETGATAIQELIDTIIDETYTNASEAIIDTKSDYN